MAAPVSPLGGNDAVMDFRSEYLNQWPILDQRCGVRTRREEQCPEKAQFRLVWRDGDKSGVVCAGCLSGWLDALTKRGPVVVERLHHPVRGGAS